MAQYRLFGAGWEGQWIERPEQDGDFLIASELIPATEYNEDEEKERISGELEFKIKSVKCSGEEDVLIAFYGDEPDTSTITSAIQLNP